MLFSKNNTQFTYSPGRLARKMGISKPTLLKHLEDTGLIADCSYDERKWLRVPYDVVMKIAGPDILQVGVKKRKRKSKKPEIPTITNEVKSKKPAPVKQPEDYMKLARILVGAGFTVKDLINIQQTKGTKTQLFEEREGENKDEKSVEQPISDSSA